MSGRFGNAMEVKVQTASQSNPSVVRYGVHWTGTTIDWEFKFRSEPGLLLTACAATGAATVNLVSLTQDAGGYYTGATVLLMNCDWYNWEVKGEGIEGVT